MKLKLCVLAMALLGANAWAAGETTQKIQPQTAAVQPATKESLLAELSKGCIDAGNDKKACDCTTEGFEKSFSEKEWGLLLTPPKKVTSADMEAFKNIQDKILKTIDECGATQTKQ